MSIDKETIMKVASLARLDIADSDAEKYAPQLSNIMGFVEQLSELDTENIAPLASPVEQNAPLRQDEVTDGNIQKDVLANAPEELEGFFVVPKIVE